MQLQEGTMSAEKGLVRYKVAGLKMLRLFNKKYIESKE